MVLPAHLEVIGSKPIGGMNLFTAFLFLIVHGYLIALLRKVNA